MSSTENLTESLDSEKQNKLKIKYQTQGIIWLVIGVILGLCLFVAIFAQFGILENYFKTEFRLKDSAEVFRIPVRTLIGLFVTGILPIASLVDESKILGKNSLRIKIRGGESFSAIWLIFTTDLILIFLSLYRSNPEVEIWPIAPLAAAIGCSTAIIFMSRGIVQFFRKAYRAWKDYQYVQLYGIDPAREADENALLTDKRDSAVKECKTLKEKVDSLTKDLDDRDSTISQLNKKITLSNQDIDILQVSLSKNVDELNQANLKTADYEKYIKELKQLKQEFSKVKKSFQEILPASRNLPDKLLAIDKSIAAFSFPEIDINRFGRSDGTEQVQKEKGNLSYRIRWQPDERGWKGLWSSIDDLDESLSPPVSKLLHEIEKATLPPPEIGAYTPESKNIKFASCTTLSFPQNVVIFCRDEDFFRHDDQGNEVRQNWDENQEEVFKSHTVLYQFERDMVALVYTSHEIMSNCGSRIQEIKSAINSNSPQCYED